MEEWMELMRELAHESGKCIMRYFGSEIAVERKADHSPVTIADRQAEACMRKIISARCPDHQIIGEEEGNNGADDARYQWLLDPIDGTKSFIHGVPLFCTLIALLEEGRPILGAIHLPVSAELMLGVQGQPTTVNGQPVRVRDTTRLEQATMAFTCTRDLWRHGHGPAFTRLQEHVELVRGWGDGYGHFMVAAGRADIMIDPISNPWDVAALKPCIAGAGGRCTDIQGGEPPLGDSALSSNGLLHDQVLAILAK